MRLTIAFLTLLLLASSAQAEWLFGPEGFEDGVIFDHSGYYPSYWFAIGRPLRNNLAPRRINLRWSLSRPGNNGRQEDSEQACGVSEIIASGKKLQNKPAMTI